MFTYQELLDDVGYLGFKGLGTGSIGKSETGFEIPYLRYGKNTGKKIIITGGIHARENVSASLVIRQAYYLAKTEISIDGEVYFIPMVNVDGALLIEKGADFFPKQRNFLIKVNNESRDFSMWKANINAVDLNTNFDANFKTGESNKSFPSPSDYTGIVPFDQSETQALANFTKSINPSATVSYHALGRELYWFFGQTINRNRDNMLAEKINKLLGYQKIDETMNSAGGYKDWCIQKLAIPSFTIELGSNELNHPLTDEDIEDDWITNRLLPKLLLESL